MKKSLGARTLVYPNPVFIIGSYTPDGMPNIMAAAWAGICCSEPPCIAFSARKARMTYDNILEKQAFTVNIPSKKYVMESDYVGIYSGKKEDKFASLGLTPVKSDYVDAPYISEFPLILECRLKQTIELGVHTQFIGEIVNTLIDEEMLSPSGIPMIDKIEPFIYDAGSRGYYGIGEFLGAGYTIGTKLKKD